MTAKHTPGPYAVFADERSIIVSADNGKVRLARMFSAKGADLHNAHLFSASTELLDATKQAGAWLARFARHAGDCQGDKNCTCGLISIGTKLLNAAAQAEGRS